jgi:hypothetical protein
MTRCPPEVADILLEILRQGLLAIRAMGCSGLANRCAHEADHLHNLPKLLEHFSPESLLYYWEVERIDYIELATPGPLSSYEPLWRRLEPLVAAIRRQTGHR